MYPTLDFQLEYASRAAIRLSAKLIRLVAAACRSRALASILLTHRPRRGRRSPSLRCPRPRRAHRMRRCRRSPSRCPRAALASRLSAHGLEGIPAPASTPLQTMALSSWILALSCLRTTAPLPMVVLLRLPSPQTQLWPPSMAVPSEFGHERVSMRTLQGRPLQRVRAAFASFSGSLPAKVRV